MPKDRGNNCNTNKNTCNINSNNLCSIQPHTNSPFETTITTSHPRTHSQTLHSSIMFVTSQPALDIPTLQSTKKDSESPINTNRITKKLPIPLKSRIIKTNKPRPYICQTCTRGFVRQEHLKRHQRSHTNEKPFLCVFCGRCFARRDLILRHQRRLHSSLMTNDSMNSTSHNTTPTTQNNTPITTHNITSTSSNSLMTDTSISSNVNTQPLVENSANTADILEINPNIIQITGNKKTILPTPNNPLAKTTVELKRDHNAIMTRDNDNPRLKRHASFSEATDFFMDPILPSQDASQIATDQSGVADTTAAPHQVGFSTPQLTTQQVLDKAVEAGLLDIPQFLLPPAVDTTNTTQQLALDASGSGSGSGSGPGPAATSDDQFLMTPGLYLSKNNLSLSNFLTMAPSAGGSMGFSSRNVPNNVDYFNFNTLLNPLSNSRLALSKENSKQSLTGEERQREKPKEMIKEKETSREKDKNTSSNTSVSGYASNSNSPSPSLTPIITTNSNMINTIANALNDANVHTNIQIPSNNNPTLSSNSSSNLAIPNDPIKNALMNVNNALSDSSSNPSLSPKTDEHWISKFISNSELEKDFRLDLNNFNQIGFFETNYSNIPSIDFTPTPNVNSDLNQSNLQKFNITNSTSNNIKTSFATPTTFENQQFHSNVNVTNPILNNNTTTNGENNNNTNGDVVIKDVPMNLMDAITLNNNQSSNLDPLISNFFMSRQQALYDDNIKNEFLPFNSNQSTPSVTAKSKSNSICSIESNSSTSSSLASNVLNPPHRMKKINFFNDSLRQFIMNDNHLTDNSFPTTVELNSYIHLYQSDFHRYFNFIHLYSIEPNEKNYMILLSIASIGALYAFHSSHSILLSKISWYHIRNYLEVTKSNHENTPLWIIQSMLLLTFFGIQTDDVKITKSMRTQLMALIRLVYLTKLNLPLEHLQVPPIDSNTNNISMDQIEKNFDYFILAQSRIRTCHNIMILSNLFSAVLGTDCFFPSADIKCGVACLEEVLFQCENAAVWSRYLSKFKNKLDSKFSLIHLSNGSESYERALLYLTDGYHFSNSNVKCSFSTLFSLLISVHERIYVEKQNVVNNCDKDSPLYEFNWKTTAVPIIQSVINNWEILYLRNQGILEIDTDEKLLIVKNYPIIRNIVPLYWLTKIRKCIHVTALLKSIWFKKWDSLHYSMDHIVDKFDVLREATDYGLNTCNFWVDYEILSQQLKKNNSYNNTPTTSKRQNVQTPIFSITCMFISLALVSEFTKRIEKWARNFNFNDPNAPILNQSHLITWFKVEKVFKKIEYHLLPSGYPQYSVANFLKKDKNSIDFEVLNDSIAERVIQPNNNLRDTIDIILNTKLSSRALYLGARMMGDTPVWPTTLLFAHGLQLRAIHNEQEL
ncbi:hypothetical protein TBLA_0B06160 [Henningerozyma blattae CBS 6284]|uniref:pH-response transcription factor pacC/RIM101 n=1 Tax=Henningerozyma blattae (strain ATCC 34711 / CBS 6284 / DSM 70876 / NBRC 10599 / NRRL Y-10934 / UCD 77-7) TaxID=1071380 RepID=I2GZ90_HENB6|nr:hypothetical protein TBLA_0B06160 [Tetrapisispora blattae CBS 6284]CCH59442.1 hypothetical protein TBLA_0B06160 [Tetrapisispora blattae CBS 6284]